MLQIEMLSLGMLQTNCYIVGDSDSREAIIVDPSDEPQQILAKVREGGYQVGQMIATHAHFDHVLAIEPVKLALNVPFRLHADEVAQLQSATQLALLFGVPAQYSPAQHDGLIEHGEIIQVGRYQLEARFTPGHSPGHLIFVCHSENVALVGDTLFKDGFGRTDLPGGNAKVLRHSIVEEILSLPDDMILYSGHGPQTTVGREKQHSAMLRYLLAM
jgi:glyoxylase-like metal-dependent hydrolase (beta-lactamase superfamily II)